MEKGITTSNTPATTSMLLGIVGMVVALVNGFLALGPDWDLLGVYGASLGLGLLAVTFGVVGLRRAGLGAPHKRMARTGLILGIGGFVLTLVVYALGLIESLEGL